MDSPSEVPTFLPCLVSPKVAVMEIAMIAAIVAILTWKPQLTLTTAVLIGFIILIGLAAIVVQVKELCRLRMALAKLPVLFEEGQPLLSKMSAIALTEEDELTLINWNGRVEETLRKYLDERRVSQFRFAGHEDNTGRYNAYRLNRKLEFLDNLLTELKS